MIVGLMGKKRSGKDTCGEYLSNKYGLVRYAFANPMKEACKILFNFTDDQVYGDLKEVEDEHWGVRPREILQVIGTEVVQYFLPQQIKGLEKVGRYFWVHRFLPFYEENKNKNICITDVRFQHEVDSIKKLGGIIIKIERDSLVSIDTHASEKEMDSITNFDYLIKNIGTIQDFHKNITKVANKIGL